MMLNVRQALQRLGGDQELYWELAGEFDARCRSYLSSLDHAIDHRHWEVAALLIHDLRDWMSRLGAEVELKCSIAPRGEAESPEAIRMAAQELQRIVPALARELARRLD